MNTIDINEFLEPVDKKVKLPIWVRKPAVFSVIPI